MRRGLAAVLLGTALLAGYSRLQAPWHLLGAPQVNVPVPRALARGESGLPLGLQVVARPGDDVRALAAARWVEQQLESL